jgi:chromosome segregation ATPase
MAEIKTAEQHLQDLKEHQANAEKRKEKIRKEREALRLQNKLEADRLGAYEDLRDDLMSAIRNSGMSFEDIHGRCGPHPHTLENWAQKVTHKPTLAKMRAAARIIGLDFGLIQGHANGN